MKAAIVTLHRVFNYGSVLQTYATCKVLERFGYETEVIDYITEQRNNKRLFLDVPDFIQKDFIHKAVYLIGKAISVLIKKKSFGRFIRKNINLTKSQYIMSEDLEKKPPVADVYVTGSDQVWNSKYNEGVDRGFFLCFAPDDKKKIAFVSSFGKSKLDVDEKEETRKYLARYDTLSVREDAAVKILDDLGFSSICLIDPTLQINRKEWIKLASKRLVKEKYLILMLLYNEDNGATEYARKIADEKGLKLIKISWEMRKPPQVDRLFTHRPPEDFLSLFHHAEFVVTNSFHGLAFSINLNKQFVVVPRNEFNSRIESLLTVTGLTRRLVSSMDAALAQSNSVINYDDVNAILECERKKAKDFLEESLK